MPKYRANASVGAWRPGDVFESDDELYANMAAAGNTISVVDDSPGRVESVKSPVPTPPSAKDDEESDKD